MIDHHLVVQLLVHLPPPSSLQQLVDQALAEDPLLGPALVLPQVLILAQALVERAINSLTTPININLHSMSTSPNLPQLIMSTLPPSHNMPI
jgi:hypothetical protein